MKYRKKPVVIEAIKWTGNNYDQIKEFSSGNVKFNEGYQYNEHYINKDLLSIITLEGEMLAQKGDFIIKGVNGEFYPCKPDIFEKTYSPEPDL